MFKKILKIIGVLILIGVAIIAGIIGYEAYQDKMDEEAQLTFQGSSGWQWSEGDRPRQMKTTYNADGTKKTRLREVNLEENSEVHASIGHDGNLFAVVYFYTECLPNSTVETSAEYSNGNKYTLMCSVDGDTLFTHANWSDGPEGVLWDNDFDGFKVEVYFRWWDFTKLQREATLRRAKLDSD